MIEMLHGRSSNVDMAWLSDIVPGRSTNVAMAAWRLRGLVPV